MKKRLLTLTAAVGLAVLAPAFTASAEPDRRFSDRQETRVTYDRRGNPIHWVKQYQGRDRDGRPVFGWVRDERRETRPARPETRVTYDRDGRPVHWVKEYQGRDRTGRPLFTWVRDERRARDHQDREDHDHRDHDRDHARDRDREHRDDDSRDNKDSKRKSILKFLIRP